MRAFGFALVVIGACVIYLGWKGKIGAALTAILTGTPPTGTTNTSSTTPYKTPVPTTKKSLSKPNSVSQSSTSGNTQLRPWSIS